MRGLPDGGPLFINAMEHVELQSPQFEPSQIIVYKLGQIESRLEAIDQKLDAKEKAQDEDIKSLQADVADLKHKDALRLGAAGGISFIIGIITQAIPWQNLF